MTVIPDSSVGPVYPAVQRLAWQALKLFVRVRHLRRPGVPTLGEKCSTVTFRMRWQELNRDALMECMRLLARGVPRGAAVSVAEFTKPPPRVTVHGEFLPNVAAVATDARASMQVLYGDLVLRFAVTWNPARKRIV